MFIFSVNGRDVLMEESAELTSQEYRIKFIWNYTFHWVKNQMVYIFFLGGEENVFSFYVNIELMC